MCQYEKNTGFVLIQPALKKLSADLNCQKDKKAWFSVFEYMLSNKLESQHADRRKKEIHSEENKKTMY